MVKPLSEYAVAEILAPPGAPVPANIAPYLRAFYIPHGDIKLRVLLAHKPDADSRGTIIISPGRTEFIEKYLEMVEDFLERRFTVLVIDHRGQGLSTRLLDDPLKSYVHHFQDYADDLGFVINALGSHLPKPQIILAHSMGGCIALHSVITGATNPSAVICSAPMLGLFDLEVSIFRWIFTAMAMMGAGARNIPFIKPTFGLPVAFKNNKLTSDPVRFARWACYFTHIAELRLDKPTLGWIRAASSSMSFVNRNAGRVKVPTLIISAGGDSIVDPASHQDFAEQSNAQLRVIPSARHEVFLEKDEYRDQFFAYVDDFLEEQAL